MRAGPDTSRKNEGGAPAQPLTLWHKHQAGRVAQILRGCLRSRIAMERAGRASRRQGHKMDPSFLLPGQASRWYIPSADAPALPSGGCTKLHLCSGCMVYANLQGGGLRVVLPQLQAGSFFKLIIYGSIKMLKMCKYS